MNMVGKQIKQLYKIEYGVDIEDFYLDIALKDADGVVAGKTQAYLDGVWKNRDKKTYI